MSRLKTQGWIFGLAALLLCVTVGCGGGENKNVVDGADQKALDDYDKMIADEEKAMGADMDSGMKNK